MRGVFAITVLVALGVGGAEPVVLAGSRFSTNDGTAAPSFNEAELRRILQHHLAPPPPDPTNRFADDPAAAHLGQFLFFDKRMSANGEVSCATCHDPQKGFSDALPLGTGLAEMPRHTKSLWNAAYNRWFFWDGRADSLWSQALEPLEHEREHGTSRTAVARLMYHDPDLRKAYEQVFGPMPDLGDSARFPEHARPVHSAASHPHHQAWMKMSEADQRAVNQVFVNVGKAIAAYQRRIISRDAPFDLFLDGLRENDPAKLAALSPSARRGLHLFIGEANCRLCHFGPNFTDGEFHNTGVPMRAGFPLDAGRHAGIAAVLKSPFNAIGEFSDDPECESADNVRYLANSPEMWGAFKTPSLRNVAQTAPYMRQGQFATLREVIHFYSTLEGAMPIGHHQETILVPLNLTESQIDDLVAFLESLTGQPLPEELTRQPDSPILQR